MKPRELRDVKDIIDPRADWHLDNWRDWMRMDRYGNGFPKSSHIFASGGISGEDAFDCMVESADKQTAKLADAVISDLEPRYQCAIHNVYLGSVWRFRGDPAAIFVDAVAEFWGKARRLGLS